MSVFYTALNDVKGKNQFLQSNVDLVDGKKQEIEQSQAKLLAQAVLISKSIENAKSEMLKQVEEMETKLA